MLEFLVDNIFVVFAGKVFPADSRHSNGYELCPSSRRHLSVFIRSGFHTIFALYGKETFSISVQSHLQVHRWCIVHKQPRIRKLSGPDVSCWTWDQGHHREHDFCFLPRFTSVDWEGWSTSHFHLRQARWFQFPHHKLSVHRRPMACLSLNLYDTPGLAPRMNVLFWGPGDFPVSYSNRDTLWNAWNRHLRSFMVHTGILLSNME